MQPKTVMYQMHNIFTYRVKHSSSTAWLRRATYKCIKLRNCLLFLLCSVCFFLFCCCFCSLRHMTIQKQKYAPMCAESVYLPFLHCCGFLATIGSIGVARCKVIASPDNITHLHASMQHTAGSTERFSFVLIERFLIVLG